MAIQKREQLIEIPEEELPRPEARDEELPLEEDPTADLHFCYKEDYPEYKETYKAVKAKMTQLLKEAWDEGKLMVRKDDADDEIFFATLDEIKEKVPGLFKDHVTSHYPPLIRKWLLEGLEDEEKGILNMACHKLVEEEILENEYGKLGEMAFRMEASYIDEMYPGEGDYGLDYDWRLDW